MRGSETGDLAAAVERARARALASGALLPVTVERAIVEDGGVAFRVEWLSSLAMKDLAAKIPRPGDRGGASNPFLPFETDLWVADLSATHVAILNKFPSIPGHMVVITRDFVEQDLPLTFEDLHACARLLGQIDGLVFYQSGPEAGASQRHRHLQLAPGFVPPLSGLLPADGPGWTPGRAPLVPFAHLHARLDRAGLSDEAFARRLLELVDAASDLAGLAPIAGRRPPYNLLLTRDWLLLVPRGQECAAGVSLSALSYGGLIGLRHAEDLARVADYGPMRMLRDASKL